MKQGKTILALLLALALLLPMGVCALAEDADIVVTEAGSRMTVKCVDTNSETIRDNEEDYLDLSKDQVLDASSKRPVIENYSYVKTMLGTETLSKLTVSHNESGPVITAVVGEGESAAERTLTGSETILYVYEKEAEHVHVWDAGTTTKEPGCTEPGIKTFRCACGETRTEDIAALGHAWGEVGYTWAEDNSSCTAERVCSRDASHKETETVKPTELITKEPSCTEAGEKSLSASFTNEAFAAQSKTAEIPALGHDYAHGRCKRCGGIDPDFKPKLTDKTGGHASWGTDYTVTSDAARKDFQKVLVDGQELPSSDYSVSEKDGNTVVTLKGAAVKKLKVGEHKIAVVSVTGTAEKKFSVSDKPKTGDEGVALWTGLLLLSALGCGTLAFTAKKKFQ